MCAYKKGKIWLVELNDRAVYVYGQHSSSFPGSRELSGSLILPAGTPRSGNVGVILLSSIECAIQTSWCGFDNKTWAYDCIRCTLDVERYNLPPLFLPNHIWTFSVVSTCYKVKGLHIQYTLNVYFMELNLFIFWVFSWVQTFDEPLLAQCRLERGRKSQFKAGLLDLRTNNIYLHM